jgi:hypothetical protein
MLQSDPLNSVKLPERISFHIHTLVILRRGILPDATGKLPSDKVKKGSDAADQKLRPARKCLAGTGD